MKHHTLRTVLRTIYRTILKYIFTFISMAVGDLVRAMLQIWTHNSLCCIHAVSYERMNVGLPSRQFIKKNTENY